MVVIRLSRGGAKKRPFYNIIATDRQNRRDGRFLERLGYYNPMAAGKDQPLVISLERVEFWTKQGAQTSDAVSKLISRQARGPVEADETPRPSKKAQAKAKALAEAQAAAAQTPAAE